MFLPVTEKENHSLVDVSELQEREQNGRYLPPLRQEQNFRCQSYNDKRERDRRAIKVCTYSYLVTT